VTLPTARHPFATRAYVEAAGGGSRTIEVPAWNATVLARSIPGTPWVDATGCYPFLPFGQTVDLAAGLEQLRAQGLISIVLVTDPLHLPAQGRLAAFDLCRAYKTHHMFERSLGPINRTRRYWREVRIAREALRIAEVEYPEHAEEFARLYANLVDHHGIVGAAAFDMAFFAALRDVPGIRAIAAWLDEQIVSMMLFVVHTDTAYAFLAGTTEEGRARCAHYGLYAEAIEGFTEAKIVNLGGAPGLSDNPDHGIVYVKRKLTNTTRFSHLCGAILRPDTYMALAATQPRDDALTDPAFFPVYRAPPVSGLGGPA
jgi:hypothetical protein